MAPSYRSGGAIPLLLGSGLLTALGMLTGCGPAVAAGHGAVSPQRSTAEITGQEAAGLAARARADVAPLAQDLSRRLRSAGVPLSAAPTGTYVPCGAEDARLMYSAGLFARPAAAVGARALSGAVTRILRAAGWTVRPVKLAEGPMPTVPHPAFLVNRARSQGAVSILPDPRTGSQVLIFLNSRCFGPGPLSRVLQRETVRD